MFTDSEEPRAGYFYIAILIAVIFAFIFGIIRFLESVHVF